MTRTQYLNKTVHNSVGARVVKGGWVGLYGRPLGWVLSSQNSVGKKAIGIDPNKLYKQSISPEETQTPLIVILPLDVILSDSEESRSLEVCVRKESHRPGVILSGSEESRPTRVLPLWSPAECGETRPHPHPMSRRYPPCL